MTTTERPHVICHMTSSVDGRIKTRRWTTLDADDHYETIHERLDGDAWMCGRITMQGYADSAKPLSEQPDASEAIDRSDHIARTDAAAYAIALDAHGRLDWGARNDIEGDHVVVVLTAAVSDDHLRRLRAGGQSYIIAGETTVDFPLALRKLRQHFGIARLLVEGGGRINGSMLKAGVVDELSLLVAPAVDGLIGTPALFDVEGGEDESLASKCRLTLTGCEQLDGGTVWLRYGISTVEAS
ncbi:dihydrofolate reductase family protein [Methylobacterium haplocladii]|uniref:2-hydroxy-3-oxopropionate reductase n=1 Tax=Methylobacterium haplocladii TaxID=1176176 RepID=A0A512ILC9_9HYPH|nr:dihydrofolate reductase family protein [Methylobacterium haplocladii]GEO98509.1 2-hydroxy-3-oxopropionate reductase [Methylobacterium haplocladii]GJD82814.1 2,5-diamino-6-ribosylamino-4(3H)-pyrimidinone 5'-phosphate reductase [Methylobacterium haplocladii]GLS60181.1 2-hydroxy-3-oxopropionate reductase [Methylobacterium haplocladii]